MRYIIVFIFTSLVLSSCSHKNEAMELSYAFFTSLSDTTYGKPCDYYPLYDSLYVEAKSDVVDINETDIVTKGDTMIVRCFNNYTDSKGTFKQDSVTLLITKDKESSWSSTIQKVLSPWIKINYGSVGQQEQLEK